MKKAHFLLVFLIPLLNSCNTTAQKKMDQYDFLKTFVSNYNEYGMDIQSAGIATVPMATLSNKNILYIEYAYRSEGENRKGEMTLEPNQKTKRFEGTWKTVADKGNVCQGNIYLELEEDGQAKGFYEYDETDYGITIFKQ